MLTKQSKKLKDWPKPVATQYVTILRYLSTNKIITSAQYKGGIKFLNALFQLGHNRNSFTKEELFFFFNSADVDANGLMTLQEFKDTVNSPTSSLVELIQNIFYMTDANHDSNLTLAELNNTLPVINAILGLNESFIYQRDAYNFFTMADTNGDHNLTLAEVQAAAPASKVQFYTILFYTVDMDQNGRISLSDFLGAVAYWNAVRAIVGPANSITSLDLATFFNNADLNHDGQLTLDELRIAYKV